VGIRVSYQIKRKRERKEGGQKEEEKLYPFLLHPKLCSHMLYYYFFKRHARQSYF
jgi:hypothetical protein